MSTWAFDPGCESMDRVPLLPDFDWLSDTSVPGPPEAIFDCLDFDVPVLPDPPVCPVLPDRVLASSRTVRSGYEKMELRFAAVSDDCAFDVALDADFPVACPAFPAGYTEARVSSVPPGQEGLRIRVVDVSDSGPECRFDFDVSVDYPCVSIRPDVSLDVSYVPPSAGGMTLTLRKADLESCSYSMEGVLRIPQPPTLFGKVLSGLGRVWSTQIYPGGPSDSANAFSADVSIENASTYEYPPVGSWIGPISPINPPPGGSGGVGGGGPWGAAGGAYAYPLPSFLEIEVGKTSSGGVAGLNPGTLQAGWSDTVAFYKFNGTNFSLDASRTGRVFNAMTGAVSGNTFVLIAKVMGYRFVIAEDCPTQTSAPETLSFS